MQTLEIEMFIPASLKDEPFFYNIIQKFNVVPNIKEASFSTDMWWAVVQFKGEPAELKNMLEYLQNLDIKIKDK